MKINDLIKFKEKTEKINLKGTQRINTGKDRIKSKIEKRRVQKKNSLGLKEILEVFIIFSSIYLFYLFINFLNIDNLDFIVTLAIFFIVNSFYLLNKDVVKGKEFNLQITNSLIIGLSIIAKFTVWSTPIVVEHFSKIFPLTTSYLIFKLFLNAAIYFFLTMFYVACLILLALFSSWVLEKNGIISSRK
ncbi:hypothetical protein LMK05_13295 (plasmid) [Lactococcus petauri]|nr:hypothetical protein LMK05_13295 [Lactococcus petauri]